MVDGLADKTMVKPLGLGVEQPGCLDFWMTRFYQYITAVTGNRLIFINTMVSLFDQNRNITNNKI